MNNLLRPFVHLKNSRYVLEYDEPYCRSLHAVYKYIYIAYILWLKFRGSS